MNLVEVCETKPPTGEKPIRWSLLTTEPVTTEEDVLRIVDAYRTRWLIEEFFKALKTGCAFERMQLESFHALHNALALCLPMAWQMLLLRAVARDKPELPAEAVLAKETVLGAQQDRCQSEERLGTQTQNQLQRGSGPSRCRKTRRPPQTKRNPGVADYRSRIASPGRLHYCCQTLGIEM